MVLNQRIELRGDKVNRIIKAMENAGWFNNRQVEISNIEKYYNERGITLFSSAKKFFLEFSGIASKWYIEVRNLHHAPDFTFELFPYPISYKTDVRDYMFDDAEFMVYSEDYQGVERKANEGFILVGQIGYYYPACVWIGESGKLYATHDYDEQVYVFNSVFELIEHELQSHEMTSVAMKL
ncbi:SUKH-3 domain-containing protein [Clostridium sp. MSJ-11]|uniref:SUKH-3 domain-containing protein n=1 Tax=Clostridium mobile TaxID=2841512 RepID=A0ABS6EH49_9CLOT|nr:SUKH-3 domain-containing protein [Clostridium mobile]